MVHLSFIQTNLSANICKQHGNLLEESCPCGSIEISEPSIWNQTKQNYCVKEGVQQEYISLTNRVRVTLHYITTKATNEPTTFRIKYQSKGKFKFIYSKNIPTCIEIHF